MTSVVVVAYNIMLYYTPTHVCVTRRVSATTAPEIRPRFNFFLIGCAHNSLRPRNNI